jgi:hypothetical protein
MSYLPTQILSEVGTHARIYYTLCFDAFSMVAVLLLALHLLAGASGRSTCPTCVLLHGVKSVPSLATSDVLDALLSIFLMAAKQLCTRARVSPSIT